MPVVPSLVVQRLRLHASNERNMGLIPGWGTKICRLDNKTKKKKKRLPWWLSGRESTSAGDMVQSLSWEDILEKELATHSSILAWKISRTEESGGLHSMESQKSQLWLSD